MFVKDMLKEELENSMRIKSEYEAALAGLPQGALVRKLIGGHVYYYLVSRQEGLVAYQYVGKLDEEDVQKYAEAKNLRASYRKQIRDLNKQIRYLQKVTRGN